MQEVTAKFKLKVLFLVHQLLLKRKTLTGKLCLRGDHLFIFFLHPKLNEYFCLFLPSESVRVLSDAIKRQVNRNAHAGHDLLQSKTEAYAANERMHADNFSQKLEGLGAQLQEAEAAAATAEQQIDGERRRHAAAKKEIAEKATEEMAALEEEEAAAVRQQHRSEAHMTQREKQLKKEQKELKEARKQHKHALQEAEKHKKEIQHIIDKERQEKREEEEAEEAREENLEGNIKKTIRQKCLSASIITFLLLPPANSEQTL